MSSERLDKMAIVLKPRKMVNRLFNRSLARSVHVAIGLLLGRANLTGPELHYLVLMMVRSVVRQWPDGQEELAAQLEVVVQGIREGKADTLQVELAEDATGSIGGGLRAR